MIFFILLLSGLLRLYRISDYMTFLGDEGRDVLVAYNILHGKLTLLGPTSSVGGFFLGPIYYYFMAPFLWLFHFDPVGPAVMVALFGVFTVWLVYKIGVELFNQKAGLIAASLYAISPLVIAYSRSSWNPNLMPTFTLLTLYVLYHASKKNSVFLFLLCGFLFGIIMQLHYVGLFVGAIIIVYVITTRFKLMEIARRGLLLFIGFVVGLSPWFFFEIRHGFPNIKSITTFIFYSPDVGSGGSFTQIWGNIFFRLFGRLITSYPPPEQVNRFEHTNIAIWYYLTIILGIIVVIKFLKIYYRSFLSKDNSFLKYHLLLVWFVGGIFLFGFYQKAIYDYYFEFMFPLPFLFVGNGLTAIARKGKWFEFASVIIFLGLVIINLQGIPFRFSANRQKDQVKEIADFVLSKTDGKPFNFALLTLGNSDHAYRYFFKIEDRDPVVIQTFKSDPQRKSVTNQLLVVCEDPNCQPEGAGLWEVAGFGRAQIVGKWHVSVLNVYKLVHYKGK